jgi:hypothetical protein
MNKDIKLLLGIIAICEIVLIVIILFVVPINNIISPDDGGRNHISKEINDLFKTDSKISIDPETRLVNIKQGSTGKFAVDIKNLVVNDSGSFFSYAVIYRQSNCNLNKKEAENLIFSGNEREEIFLSSGENSTQRVSLKIPLDTPLCLVRFEINVTKENTYYASDFIDVKIN